MPITIVLAMPDACLRRIVHANSRAYFSVRGFASFSRSLGRTGASTTRMSQATARLQEKSAARKSNPVGAWSGLERRCRPGVIHERRSPQRSCTHLPTAASFLPSRGRTYPPLRDWMIIGPDVFAGRRKAITRASSDESVAMRLIHINVADADMRHFLGPKHTWKLRLSWCASVTFNGPSAP